MNRISDGTSQCCIDEEAKNCISIDLEKQLPRSLFILLPAFLFREGEIFTCHLGHEQGAPCEDIDGIEEGMVNEQRK